MKMRKNQRMLRIRKKRTRMKTKMRMEKLRRKRKMINLKPRRLIRQCGTGNSSTMSNPSGQESKIVAKMLCIKFAS